MLLLKMLRDFTIHKAQFISIFLMSALGVFIYAGVSAEWSGMKSTADRYYEERKLADAWIFSENFTIEDEEAIKSIEGITEAERRLTIDSTVLLEGSPSLTLHFIDKNLISQSYKVEGEEFSQEEDGIWLDHLFAKTRGLKPGDNITITAFGYKLEKVILGLVMNPEYVYAPGEDDIVPNHANYGFGYIPAGFFPDIIPIIYNEMLVTCERQTDTSFEEDISKALKDDNNVILTRKYMKSHMQFDIEVNQHKAIGRVFPIVFLCVAMLTILTTMTRLVNNQRTQIGVLKAIGFKKRKILIHYISYGFWVSLAGAVLGSILGPMILPGLFYPAMQTTYTLPEWKPAIPYSIILMSLLSVAGSTLATFLACRRHLRDTPSQSLRPKPPRIMRHSILEKLKLWNRCGFNIKWNLRDALRTKLRSVMVIVGILGCSAILLCAFGMKDSLDYYKQNFDMINNYRTRMLLSEDITQESFNDIIERFDAEAIMEDVVELMANGIKRSGSLLVNDHVTLINFYDYEYNPVPLPDDEISISYKMAKHLKVKEGDEISWHIYGDTKWKSARVAAIYRTPADQGITMSKEYFNNLGFTFKPTSVISGQTVIEEPAGVEKLWAKEEMTKSYDALMEAMNLLIYVLMLAAVVLAVVVLYNLGVLSFTERYRELSTLKVIGFKTGRLRTLLLTQNIWMTALGILPGIPTGLWVLDYMFRFMGDNLDFVTKVEPGSYLYSILGTFLISVMMNRLFSKRVKNIDMVSALKGVE